MCRRKCQLALLGIHQQHRPLLSKCNLPCSLLRHNTSQYPPWLRFCWFFLRIFPFDQLKNTAIAPSLEMVNLFPDYVQYDTKQGRKASYLYISMLICSMLAAALYYSLAPLSLIKTATSKDDFFGLDMYRGTTGCDQWCVLCNNWAPFSHIQCALLYTGTRASTIEARVMNQQ